jgi:diacylglycerol kinase family enzyme
MADRPWLPLILNARAGGLLSMDAGALLGRLSARLEAAGFAVEGHLVEGSQVGPLTRAALARVPVPAAVLVGGGDGSLIAAAEPLLGGDIPLGVLPLGTLNLLARDLCLPLDPEAALAAMEAGVLGRVDVARVNGRPFLNLAVLGVKSAITRYRERRRGTLSPWGWLKVLGHAFKVYRRTPRSRLRIHLPGEERQVRVHALGVTANPLDDGARPILARDRLNAGVLGVYIARHRGRWGLVKQLLALLRGRWKRDPDLDVLEVPFLTIETRRRRLHLTVDGEPVLETTPLRFSLVPGALPVLAAARARDRVSDPRPSPLGTGP